MQASSIAAIFKRLRFPGMKLVTEGEGEIRDLHAGLKGTMSALCLKDLADKTGAGSKAGSGWAAVAAGSAMATA